MPVIARSSITRTTNQLTQSHTHTRATPINTMVIVTMAINATAP